MLAALVVVPLTVLVVGWARDRVFGAFTIVALALGALWVGALLAFATDLRDADGSLDCWPGCTLFQDGVRTVAVFALPALVAVGFVALILRAFSERRRAARRPG